MNLHVYHDLFDFLFGKVHFKEKYSSLLISDHSYITNHGFLKFTCHYTPEN